MDDLKKWETLCRQMTQSYPVLANVWMQAPLRFGAGWIQEAVPNIEKMYGSISKPLSQTLLDMLEGYAEFSNDSMRNQVFYERNGRYKASNYEQVREQLYFNEDHMTRCYLPGMFVSHYIWPQHFNMLRGFRSNLLPRIAGAKIFFEVGVGCGMYSKVTLEAYPTMRGVGFDISQFALDYTGKVMEAFGLRDRYHLENRDIRLGYEQLADFLICQEVLEHLENPAEFCRWLFALVRPGGVAYITAALNAAHSDHIYLFHRPDELEGMLRDAGFQPLSSQEECAAGYKPRNLTPSLSGFFCQRPT
jgi:2-polyprenyl-3-methyl-5-hydroxy-6-metoxy-1,4-benzoquinol methylase